MIGYIALNSFLSLAPFMVIVLIFHRTFMRWAKRYTSKL